MAASTLDTRSRVTVVGTRKRVDVAVPTAAPIGEYVAGLAELCGQDRLHPLPASWSLAPPGAATLALDASLGSAGITDGDVLYLRDLARDPVANPIVDDVDELTAEQVRPGREDALRQGMVVMTFGLLWIAATAGVALRLSGPLIGPAVALAVLALGLVAAAWSLHHRSVEVRVGLRLAVALAAVPCLAAAGTLLADALADPHYGWCGAIAGVNAGALLAVAAIPDGVLIAVQIQAAAAALLALLLVFVHATAAQAAALVVLLALALLGLSKLLAATIAAWSLKPSRSTSSVGQVVAELVVRSRLLTCAVSAGPALALGAAFIALAVSAGGFAVALVAVASVALVARARQRGFTHEVVLVGGAGVVGAFAVAAVLLNRYAGDTLTVVAFGACGLAVLGLGVFIALSRREDEPSARSLAGGADTASLLATTAASRPNRFRFLDVIGRLCQLACPALALGVFGVFPDLVQAGRSILG